MARSKTKVLNVEQDNFAEFVKVQVELENGEVIIAGYQRHMWFKAPKVVAEEYFRIASAPPQTVYRKKRA